MNRLLPKTWRESCVCWLLVLGIHSNLWADAVEKPASESQGVSQEIPDPLRPMNEVFFDLNQGLDEFVLEPVTRGYEAAVPPLVRDGIHNSLRNLSFPKTFLNSVLQGNVDKAATSLVRFLINSTFGFLGFVDVAAEMGVEAVEEDFGRTLKMAGMETGPYLVLPVIGATSFRDGLGLLVDTLTDPFNLIVCHNKRPQLMYVRWGVDLVDWRLQYLESYQKLKETSLDLYSTIRSLYDQKRGDRGALLLKSVSGSQNPAETQEEPVYSEDIEA
ncbi:MAG: MlaA family lipoprotein [Alphaproteobacteria bacterium]